MSSLMSRCRRSLALARTAASLVDAVPGTSSGGEPRPGAGGTGPGPGLGARAQGTARPEATVRSAMRGLLRAVHPDFFRDFPSEQAANEASFKALQGYLGAAGVGATGGRRDGDGGGPSETGAVRVTFYVRGPGAGGVPVEGVEVRDADVGLRRVTSVLPAPMPGRGGGADPRARRALLALAAACGAIDPSEVPARGPWAAGDAGAGPEPGAGAPLAEFLAHAAGVARRQELETRGHRDRVASLRGAFRLGRGIVVGTAAVAGDHPLRQVGYLTRLARAVDVAEGALPAGALRGQRVHLGHRTGVDVAGGVWLDVTSGDDAGEAWGAFLAELRWGEVAARRAALERLRALERDAADALGVGAVYASHALSGDAAYRELLRGVCDAAGAARAAGVDPTGGARLPLVAVRVAEEGAGGGGAPAAGFAPGFAADPGGGTLEVPAGAGALSVLEFVAGEGARVQAGRARREAEERALAALAARCRTRLRLRRLLRDPTVSGEQFRRCLERLMGGAPRLWTATEGLSIRVSSDSRPPAFENPGVIDVAWDSEL